MGDKYRQNEFPIFITVISLSVMLVFFTIIIGVSGTMVGGTDSDRISFDHGWYIVEGNEESVISGFYDNAAFSTQMSADQVNGRSLCFLSKNVLFDVLVDGEVVYSFRPKSLSVFGKFYGSYPHEINLGAVGSSSSVEIRAEAIDSSKGSFTEICLESGNSFVTDIFKTSLLPYCVSVVIALMGISLVLGGLALMRNTGSGMEISAMGLFALCAGVWTACSTGVAGMVLGTPITMHFVSYISLIILPAFGVMFVCLLTGRRYARFANVLIALTGLTLIAEIILTASGVSTYHNMLTVNHIECLLAVVYTVMSAVAMMKVSKKHIGTRIVMAVAFFSVVVGGIIDLIRYFVSEPGIDSAYFFRLGLMLFVFILGINEIYALMTYRKYETEAEALSKLAYTDALTGLKNRMAFTDQEDFSRPRAKGNGIIIQFDINNLKLVNDTYGHKEGDRHIMAGAEIINNSFGQIGNCYRTGGDEFIVVIEELKDRLEFEQTKVKFQKMIDEYNEEYKPRIKLEIAYGIEEFDLSSGDVEGALKLADGKMYSMKKKMKGNNTNPYA
ncbi:MAG: diguanylate cyclase [Clostridiales bacterium]|nr:diguanylate cyclase [Clostridiales bacterium]